MLFSIGIINQKVGALLFLFLLIVFIVVPAVEIALFIWTGGHIGLWSVLLLIILTGILGTMVVRHEGLETIRKAQLAMQQGEVPRDQLLDGILILIGAILLITPGFFTDAVGFLIVFPLSRKPFKKLLTYYILKKIKDGSITFRRF